MRLEFITNHDKLCQNISVYIYIIFLVSDSHCDNVIPYMQKLIDTILFTFLNFYWKKIHFIFIFKGQNAV